MNAIAGVLHRHASDSRFSIIEKQYFSVMKFNNLFIIFICLLSAGCTSSDMAESTTPIDTVIADQPVQPGKQQLPFIGTRYFETRPGVSGTGTPHRKLEIKAGGTVEFSFIQINQADETETRGTYNAGPFMKIMKCVFTEWDNETRFYEITVDKIYETDSNGVHLTSEECCPDLEPKCPCESEYFEESFW